MFTASAGKEACIFSSADTKRFALAVPVGTVLKIIAPLSIAIIQGVSSRTVLKRCGRASARLAAGLAEV